MRDLLGGLCGFLLVVFIGLITTAAFAAERVVMPYTCTVSGGVPRLLPSDDRGYKILGQRDQREFVACSPTRPNHCRKWNVHRFKIDCGGVTVPWVSVVAAGNSEHRVWLRGDQLTIRMPWSWIFPRHHPCVRMQNFDSPPRRLQRMCRNRSIHAPESVVTMPPGFAPKFGIDAIFVKARPKPPAVAVLDKVPVQEKPAPVAVPKSAPPLEDVNVEPPAPPEPSGSSAVAAVAPETTNVAGGDAETTVTTGAETSAGDKKTAKPVSPEPKSTVASKTPKVSPKESPTSSAPIVINSIRGVRAGSPGQETAAVDAQSSERIFEVGQGLRVPPETTSSVSRTDQIRPERVAGWWAIDRWDPVTWALIGVGGLVSLFAAGRLSGWTRPAGGGDAALRDIASVTLGRSKTRQKASTRDVAVRAKGSNEANQHQVPPTPKFSFDNSIPKSREEALSVLGMSQTSDASAKAVKKIVDGLRLSWHPDHAANEADRQLREARLKQINIAWEIIENSDQTGPSS